MEPNQKPDALAPGQAQCDHCGQQKYIGSGGIGAFYFGQHKGKPVIRWLCRVKCLEIVEAKAKAWERSKRA